MADTVGVVAGRRRLAGWRLLLIFVIGVFVMRALGCVINDFADRKLDAQVARTRNRPLAAGRISVAEATGVGVFFLLSAFLLWLLLPPTAQLWAIPALTLADCILSPNGFSPCRKRFWAWHLVLVFQWLMRR